MFSKRLTAFLLATCFCFLSLPAFAQSSQQFESVIIQAAKPYTKLSSDIQALGGIVTYQYKYVDAIAAKIPSNAMDRLSSVVGSATISKDLILPAPTAKKVVRRTKGNSSSPITNLNSIATAATAAYSLNNLGLNVEKLHGIGYTGAGVIVAVVDSGVRPNYPVLDSDNSVIGGIDFVGDGLGFSNSNNDPHGTFVSGLISGNTLINVSGTTLESSVQVNFPGALVGSDLPLIGTAPSSSIYEVRVFGVNAAAGAPESRIIAAIDYIIDLRLKYLKGDPSGLNIQVCNLSLGNTTLYAGRDIFDRSVGALLANGIIPVVSAGDGGPSGLTVSSPATSFSSIAVGAASPAANERVQIDVDPFFGLGFGVRYRPNAATQVAWFSSRGPNADGRISPDVIAVGVGNFGQGYGSTTDVELVSGTSFSAPLVAGVAAVLRQAFPNASANQIRNAIIGSGNPSIAGARFTQLDQGSGFPDAQAAFNNFATFPSSPPDSGSPSSSVAKNIKQVTGLDVESDSVNRSTGNLAPGQRSEILYLIKEDTSRVVITVSNFKSDPNVSPANLFAEEIYFQVHSAKTSQIGAFGDYFNLGDPFITGGTFTINNPEPGVMRITLSGSYTNEKSVSADVAVNSFKEPTPGQTTKGKIDNHEQIVFPVTIPQGVSVAEFRLSFRDDWGNYPTSDIDMILFDPNLNRNTDGAHLNAPEKATVLNPIPGTWLVLINGFDIPAGSDKYELRVALDGKVIK
jgi:subtilisin family serine protease